MKKMIPGLLMALMSCGAAGAAEGSEGSHEKEFPVGVEDPGDVHGERDAQDQIDGLCPNG